MNIRLRRKLSWGSWVTPRPLRDQPIHNWFVFPHSFTSQLVHALITNWSLRRNSLLLDPFSGAGTSILASKEDRVPAIGFDLSPLAVLATNAKVVNKSVRSLRQTWMRINESLEKTDSKLTLHSDEELINRAFSPAVKLLLGNADHSIRHDCRCRCDQDFFRLALISSMHAYSRAVATGGWLKWRLSCRKAPTFVCTFARTVERMLTELEQAHLPRLAKWHAYRADARTLPDDSRTYSAVITSPPYPNRHDHTRVFGVELLSTLLSWEELRALRYQSFHSHPEARPNRPEMAGYEHPRDLKNLISRTEQSGEDQRIVKMLDGYFLDQYLCLRELRRVCRPGARVALIVGNAQYSGHPVPVDRFTAELGIRAGLDCKQIIVVRYRGNSAQQMASYGRRPARESIVLFSRP